VAVAVAVDGLATVVLVVLVVVLEDGRHQVPVELQPLVKEMLVRVHLRTSVMVAVAVALVELAAHQPQQWSAQQVLECR
jgi:hypothetical protein